MDKSLASVLGDSLIGGFAAFLLWLFSGVMNSQEGEILIAIVAGLMGAQALNTVIQAMGYKNERDLFAQAMADENALDEDGILEEIAQLRKANQEKDLKIGQLEKQVAQAQTLEQLEALKARIDRIEDKTSSEDDDDESNQKQSKRRK